MRRLPFLHEVQGERVLFSFSVSLRSVIPFRISFPISISFALNSFDISVIRRFAFSKTMDSISLKLEEED